MEVDVMWITSESGKDRAAWCSLSTAPAQNPFRPDSPSQSPVYAVGRTLAPTAGRPKPPRKRGSFGSDDMRLLLFGISGHFVLGGGEEFGQGSSFTVGVLPRDIDLQETERLGQPARTIEQPLGLARPVALFLVIDELYRFLALCLAHGLEETRCCNPAEIVVHGRFP